MALKRMPLSMYQSSVMEFVRGTSRGRWDLDPPYQRGDVWSIEQRRNLIKSMMMGLPVGALAISARNDDARPEVQGVVVDGKQRLTTLLNFFDSEFSVPGEWFAPEGGERYLKRGAADLEWVEFDHLTETGQRLWFRSLTIGVVEAAGLTIAEEADWYLAINFGGVGQTETDRARAERIAQA